jgi:phosphoribosyl-AMP cyclohydrolase / phosphoribosyl-ATP pyrophosphohydrolase
MIKPDFEKCGGLIPAVIQDESTNKVLMLGYMNAEALEKTEKEAKVTFFSRSKGRLWTKGESSGNFLFVKHIFIDCDNDTILVKVNPAGPVCHTGADTCFEEKNSGNSFLQSLETVIWDRKLNPDEQSYTASLFKKGINKVAQKLGEEAIELVIEAKDNNKELFLGEAADLMYHYLVLLAAKDIRLDEVLEILEQRHKK